MQVAVFGANGKVGRLVVAELLARGHSVKAFVHKASNLPDDPRLSIIKGDVNHAASVEKALSNSDAVISALGSWGTKQKDIVASGMHNIVPAMERLSVDRIISLTGAAALTPGESGHPLHRLSRFFVSMFAGKILNDGEEHIRILHDSNLLWTVVRSPIMNDRGNLGRYVLRKNPVWSWATINRHAVAASLVDLLDDTHYNKQAPYIARR